MDTPHNFVRKEMFDQVVEKLELATKHIDELEEAIMGDQAFRAFLNLLMCSDPWPIGGSDREALYDFANHEAVWRGYKDWVEAYHNVLRLPPI